MKKIKKKKASAKGFAGKDRRTGSIDPIYQRLVSRGILPDRRKGDRRGTAADRKKKD